MDHQYPLTANNLEIMWGSIKGGCVPDDQEERIFTAVGRSLTKWENADQVFVEIYGSFFSSNQFDAKRVYGGQTSYQKRLLKFEGAYKSYLDLNPNCQNLKGGIELLKAHFELAYQIRGNIAHGTVRSFPANGSPQFLLVPSEWSFKKLSPLEIGGKLGQAPEAYKTKYFYNSIIINEYADKFESLMKAGIGLLGALSKI